MEKKSSFGLCRTVSFESFVFSSPNHLTNVCFGTVFGFSNCCKSQELTSAPNLRN